MSTLGKRIDRLEDTQARRGRQPCRWDAPVVIYPATVARDETGQPLPPQCERPAKCPGAGRVQILLPERG